MLTTNPTRRHIMAITLKTGTVFTVPAGPLDFLEDAKLVAGSAEQAETPKVLRLKPVKKRPGVKEPKPKGPPLQKTNKELPEEFDFTMRQINTKDGRHGRVLFVPDGITSDTKLKIVWVDPQCACAQLAEA